MEDCKYKANHSYHISYKKSKNPAAYFRRYESQIILYGGARRMLEQVGLNLKGLNIEKLKTGKSQSVSWTGTATGAYF